MSTNFTTSKITLAGALVLPVLVLALSGCTGSQPSQVLPSESSSGQPAEPEGTPAAEPQAENTVITLSLKFMPNDITVKVGDTVTWQNGETIGHTITSGEWGDVNESTGLRGTQTPDGMFDHALSPKGSEGDTFSFTFTEAGTYKYYCQPHLTMNATVIVEP
ncbi:MAG: plastocyanin/azurin family copper-binding protein [Rhodoglobus sp.]